MGDSGEDQEGEVDDKHEAKDSENELCQFGAVYFFPSNHELLHKRANYQQESLCTEFSEMVRHLDKHILVEEQVC